MAAAWKEGKQGGTTLSASCYAMPSNGERWEQKTIALTVECHLVWKRFSHLLKYFSIRVNDHTRAHMRRHRCTWALTNFARCRLHTCTALCSAMHVCMCVRCNAYTLVIECNWQQPEAAGTRSFSQAFSFVMAFFLLTGVKSQKEVLYASVQ